MRLNHCFSFLLLSLSMLSCSTERRKAAGLYNIDSLISLQVDHLINYKPAVTKKVRLNNKEKVVTVTPLSIEEWNNELAIFSELDVINKPINKGAYTVSTYPDNKSNLKVKSFVTTDELPVKYLRVYYQPFPNKIRKIEAQYNEANSLYRSARFLTMEFEDVFDKTILTSYSITGGQKMFLDDSVQYTVGAKIILKD